MKSGIYRIQNLLTGDFYIGSAINIKTRWQRHKKDLRKGKHHSHILQRAWDKYGEGCFLFAVVVNIESTVLLESEDSYLSCLKPAYNICPTAYSPLGTKRTEAQKQHARNYAIANGVRPPESTYKDKQKSVVMLDYNTLLELQEFHSVVAAAEFLGRDCTFASTISAACSGKRFSAFGYRWRFKDDTKLPREKIPLVSWNKGLKIPNGKDKPVYQSTLKGELMKEWASSNLAARTLGLHSGAIKNCARGISKSSGGFIWAYIPNENRSDSRIIKVSV